MSDTKLEILKTIYPVGSVYMSYTDSRNPHDILGFGEWEQIKNKYLYAENGSKEGGSKYLTKDMLPEHSHTINITTEEVKHKHNEIKAHQNSDNGRSGGPNMDMTGPEGSGDQKDKSNPWADWDVSESGEHDHKRIMSCSSISCTGTEKLLPLYQSIYVWHRRA